MLPGVGELHPDVAHVRLPHVLGVEVQTGVHLYVGVFRPLVTGERGERVEQGLQLFAQQEIAHFDPGADRQTGIDWPVLGVVMPDEKENCLLKNQCPNSYRLKHLTIISTVLTPLCCETFPS